MEKITVKLNQLKPYKNNPRKNEGAVEAVAASIKECGYITPIIIDENYEILAGHTRFKALKKLGEKEAEVLMAAGLTESQKKKYRVLDNKTAEFSAWDIEKLNIELEKVEFDEFAYGFDDMDTEDFEIEEPSEYIHKSFTLHQAQKELIDQALLVVRPEINETFGNENKNGNALYEVVRQWAEQKK